MKGSLGRSWCSRPRCRGFKVLRVGSAQNNAAGSALGAQLSVRAGGPRKRQFL